MVQYADISQPTRSDGMVYATSCPLTATEADLYTGGTTLANLDPIPVLYGQSIQAVVKLVPRGGPVSINCYVVMQTDLGDGVWIDVAYCQRSNTQVTGLYSFVGGYQASAAYQQSRQAGQFPAAADGCAANAVNLGGRVRFVGKAIVTGGSSLSPGVVAGIDATITYKILGLR